MDSNDVSALIKRNDLLKKNRLNWESHWQEVANYMYPQRGDFTIERSAGEKRQQYIFDSTPVHAAELLASGLHGMLTSNDWFNLVVLDPEIAKNGDVKEWLDTATTRTRDAFNNPEAGFTTAIQEVYMDFAVFNTAVIFISEHPSREGALFMARSLSEVLLDENISGRIDTWFRTYKWSLRKVITEFGKENLSDASKRKIQSSTAKLDDQIDIIHVIMPRSQIDPRKKSKENYPFASIYIEKDAKHVIRESGFEELPFMAPRFLKASSGEIYGRGPGISTLPDVKMLNEMMKVTLKAAQKVVDPPIMAEDDSVVGRLRMVPSGINYFKRGYNAPAPFETRGRIDIGEAMMDGVRARIRESFFVDQLQLNQGPQMTATEVLQRTEEKLRLMAPVLGRLQTELLSPMISRVFNILLRQGAFPPVPASLQESASILVKYESPLARSQKQLEASGMLRTLEIMGPVLSMDPTSLDVLDSDAAFKYIGMDLYGMSPRMFRKDRKIKQIRDERAQINQQKLDQDMQQGDANIAMTKAQAEAAR